MQIRRTIPRIRRNWLGLCVVTALSCQGEAEVSEEPATMAATMTGVRITAPEDGAEATTSSVEIALAVDGVEVVPAGTVQENSGHHHLFVDQELTPVGEPIPAGQEGIIHMGDASTRYTLENLTPGEHRIIAVLGDHVHVRLPVATDTVTVVVP